MPRTFETRTIRIPTLLHERISALRLHPRPGLHEVIQEAVVAWERRGGWTPYDQFDPDT